MDNFEKLLSTADQLGPHDAADVYYKMHKLRTHMRHMDIWFYRPTRYFAWFMLLLEGHWMGYRMWNHNWGSALAMFFAVSILMCVIHNMHRVHRDRREYTKKVLEVEQAVERRLNNLKEKLNGQA